jgi:hypothetical protein
MIIRNDHNTITDLYEQIRQLKWDNENYRQRNLRLLWDNDALHNRIGGNHGGDVNSVLVDPSRSGVLIKSDAFHAWGNVLDPVKTASQVAVRTDVTNNNSDPSQAGETENVTVSSQAGETENVTVSSQVEETNNDSNPSQAVKPMVVESDTVDNQPELTQAVEPMVVDADNQLELSPAIEQIAGQSSSVRQLSEEEKAAKRLARKQRHAEQREELRREQERLKAEREAAEKEFQLKKMQEAQETRLKKEQERRNQLLEEEAKIRKQHEDRLKAEAKRKAAEEKKAQQILAAQELEREKDEKFRAERAAERLEKQKQLEKERLEKQLEKERRFKQQSEQIKADCARDLKKYADELRNSAAVQSEPGFSPYSDSDAWGTDNLMDKLLTRNIQLLVPETELFDADKCKRVEIACKITFEQKEDSSDSYKKFPNTNPEDIVRTRLLMDFGNKCFRLERVGNDQYNLVWGDRLPGFNYPIPQNVSLLQISRWLDEPSLKNTLLKVSEEIVSDVVSLIDDKYYVHRVHINNWLFAINDIGTEFADLKERLGIKICFDEQFDAFGEPRMEMRTPKGRTFYDILVIVDWFLSGKLKRLADAICPVKLLAK